MTDRHSKAAVLFLFVAAIIILSAEAWIVRGFTVDDAYITFRYAQNFTAGNGLVFNAGSERTEGYSSLLWTLLVSVPHFVRIDAAVFAKVLGVTLTFLLLIASSALGSLLARDRGPGSAVLGGAAAAFIVAAYHATAVHAVSGMETTLCTLLLTTFVISAIRCAEQPAFVRCIAAAAAGLLLGLARPELNLVVIVTGAALLRDPRARRAVAVAFVVGYVIPGAVYFAARWRYYGLFLPLPFYVKGLHGRPLSGVKDVVWFVSEFVSRLGVMVLLGLAAGITMPVVLVLAGIVPLMAFFMYPEPIMNFEWRYLQPTVPLFAALAARGLMEMRAILSASNRWSRLALPLVLGLLALYAASDLRMARIAVRERTRYAAGLERAHVRLGLLLRDRAAAVPGGDPVLAIADAGAVPYLSGWRTIDTFGLNDVTIATQGTHDPAQVFDEDPSLVVLLSLDREEFRPRLAWEADLFRACEERGWRRAAVFEFDVDYYLWCMAPAGAALERRP